MEEGIYALVAGLWLLVLCALLLLRYFFILLLVLAPLRVFYILRFALKQKDWHGARACLLLLSIITVLAASHTLVRAGIYCAQAQKVDPLVLLFDILSQARMGFLWFFLEAAFFLFKKKP